ncbi:MAG: glycosyl transferase, partial [Halieaceae bacterium MED-G27]
MKVLHIEAGRYLYGGAQQVAWLVDGLSRQGVDNVLVCPSGSSIASECRAACKVVEIPMGGDLDIVQIWRLSRLFAVEKPNLVHIHSRRGADVFGGLAAKLAGIPCVLSRRVDNRESRLMAACKYSLYARVVVISDAIGEVLRSCGVKGGLIRPVRSAVDHQRYRVTADPDWFHHEFGLPSDAMVLAMIAQLIPRKGHQYFLSILPDLLARYPNLYVLIFGQGPLADELDKRVTSEALTERVTMAGFRNDLDRVLPNLYAVIHPAEREGL